MEMGGYHAIYKTYRCGTGLYGRIDNAEDNCCEPTHLLRLRLAASSRILSVSGHLAMSQAALVLHNSTLYSEWPVIIMTRCGCPSFPFLVMISPHRLIVFF